MSRDCSFRYHLWYNKGRLTRPRPPVQVACQQSETPALFMGAGYAILVPDKRVLRTTRNDLGPQYGELSVVISTKPPIIAGTRRRLREKTRCREFQAQVREPHGLMFRGYIMNHALSGVVELG